MATMCKTFLTVTMVLLLLRHPLADGKLLAMRPLSARQVYRLLHEAGRSDAIPQGRVITQGLAAMAGFALGLTKGLGTALIFDIITANVTGLDLGFGSNTAASNSGSQATAQEICFNSRSARSLEEAEAVAEALSRDDDDDKKLIDEEKIRQSEVDRRVTKKRRNKKKKKSKRRHKKRNRLTVTKPKYDIDALGRQTGTTATGTLGPTTTDITAPITTATTATSPIGIGTATGTNTDAGAGTGTTSLSTTSTGNEGAINCIVVQKPIGRKR